jgi:tRNA A37 N6-isopentenylltransferase MiaA
MESLNIKETIDRQIVIFILGSTASGKSKLALDIALHCNGEIMNADSMQIYSGN